MPHGSGASLFTVDQRRIDGDENGVGNDHRNLMH